MEGERAVRQRRQNPADLRQTSAAGLITLVFHVQVTSGVSPAERPPVTLLEFEWESDRSHPDKGHLPSETRQQSVKTQFPVTGSILENSYRLSVREWRYDAVYVSMLMGVFYSGPLHEC